MYLSGGDASTIMYPIPSLGNEVAPYMPMTYYFDLKNWVKFGLDHYEGRETLGLLTNQLNAMKRKLMVLKM